MTYYGSQPTPETEVCKYCGNPADASRVCRACWRGIDGMVDREEDQRRLEQDRVAGEYETWNARSGG